MPFCGAPGANYPEEFRNCMGARWARCPCSCSLRLLLLLCARVLLPPPVASCASTSSPAASTPSACSQTSALAWGRSSLRRQLRRCPSLPHRCRGRARPGRALPHHLPGLRPRPAPCATHGRLLPSVPPGLQTTISPTRRPPAPASIAAPAAAGQPPGASAPRRSASTPPARPASRQAASSAHEAHRAEGGRRTAGPCGSCTSWRAAGIGAGSPGVLLKLAI